MKPILKLLTTFLLTSLHPAHAAADPVSEPWKSADTGEHSQDSHVIGNWTFDGPDATTDSGPRKLPGKLEGAHATAADRFGGAIESFSGLPKSDQRHALVVASHPALSSPAAFSAEIWVHAKPDLARSSTACLLDKKYASHNDYQWFLTAPEKSDARRTFDSYVGQHGLAMETGLPSEASIRLDRIGMHVCDLVDALIPAFPGWERWFEIAPWVAMAKGSKVEIWPGTEYHFHQISTGELTDKDVAAGKKPGAMWLLSRADYLRRADEAYAAGAHGFYLFNAGDKKHTGLDRGITDARFVANWQRHLDPENLGSEIAPDAVANRRP